MPHHKLLHEKDYLGHWDFQEKDFEFTIDGIEVLKELTMQGGVKTKQSIISFKGATKKFILSAKTNSDMIAKIHGEYTEDWMGKKITLYCGEYFDQMKKETLPCIRIRDTSGKAVVAKAKQDAAFRVDDKK